MATAPNRACPAGTTSAPKRRPRGPSGPPRQQKRSVRGISYPERTSGLRPTKTHESRTARVLQGYQSRNRWGASIYPPDRTCARKGIVRNERTTTRLSPPRLREAVEGTRSALQTRGAAGSRAQQLTSQRYRERQDATPDRRPALGWRRGPSSGNIYTVYTRPTIDARLQSRVGRAENAKRSADAVARTCE